jgi:hypothetical protein
MYRGLRAFTAAALVSAFGIVPSFAQKSGGILRVHAIDSPPSLSMHEEIDAVPARAMMGVFNNLVMFDQHAKQTGCVVVLPFLSAIAGLLAHVEPAVPVWRLISIRPSTLRSPSCSCLLRTASRPSFAVIP